MATGDVTYQSLYRRYRPSRFAEVLGQDHITRALSNAVQAQRVGQGYLFSGPRGTGKTSTARILAKALNCEKLDEGEPCGVCESCTAITAGNSFTAIELDAASNNGVDAMRDLVSRASLGTTGLRKVYIIDEVHMLSPAAANTLLKTLEEPPAHVVFVLATTDPQKVLSTIRSRVQHFEFHLLQADTLGELVRAVSADAGLGLADVDLDRVVRRGAGSARDALSALDQAAALGTATEDAPVATEVLSALIERDPTRALAAVAGGCAAGRDPRRLAEEILAALRNAFLAGRAPALVDLPADEAERAAEQGRAVGPAALVRAMERVGEALAEMREALDPRVSLEVAIVRITAPDADSSPAALLERLERLERRIAAGEPGPAIRSADRVSPPPPAPTVSTAAPGGRALGSFRKSPAAEPTPPAPAPVIAAASTPPAPIDAEPPTREELTKAWGDTVLGKLPGRVKARWSAGRFVPSDGEMATFALPNAAHRDQCQPMQGEVEKALAAHFGRPIQLRLVAEQLPADGPMPVGEEEEQSFSRSELRDAPDAQPSTPAQRLKDAFPGAQEVQG